MPDNNELDLFKEMMADVAPIKQDTVTISQKYQVSESQLARRIAAQSLAESDSEYLLDIRTVMIVHGKGERSNPPALMKSYVTTWLEQISDVLCFHSAQRQHGGTGALYVMLKKSPEKKAETRERHLNRRSE